MLNNSLSPHKKIHAPWLFTVAIWLLTQPLINALMGWIDEELGISSLIVQRTLIYAWQYGFPVTLIAFGFWFLIHPRLSGWPKSGTVVDDSKYQAGSLGGDTDAKNAAIQFFKKILNIGTPSERDWSGNLGSEADLDILADINPVGKNWVQYAIALGCYRINIEIVSDNGGKIKLLKYIGKMNHASEVNGVAYALGIDDGEKFDDGSRYDDFLDNKSLYESGILKLNFIQRREVISHFVTSSSEGRWGWPSRK